MFPPGGVAGAQYSGGVAQLGERVNGIHEVRGSIPLASMASRAVDESRLSGYICCRHAGIAQLVEHNLAKVGVAGSSPVSRSTWMDTSVAGWSSLVARRAHNPEVVGSNPTPATY